MGLLLASGLGVSCNKVNDDTIATDIKAKLFSVPELKSSSASVAVKDGVVTISGQVPDEAARAQARQIASQTPGVKQVIDETTLTSPAAATSVPDTAHNYSPRVAERPSHPAPPRKKPAPAPKESYPAEKPVQDTAPAYTASQSPADPGPLPVAPVKPAPVAAPAPPPPPQPVVVTIPSGTVVSVRTVDSIDSETSRTGQTFRGSLDAPVVVDDRVVLPKGLNVYLKIVEASSAGHIKGRSELTISLDSFVYQGKTYRVATTDVQEKGSSRGKRSAAVIGGGAVLGAIIGGIAGGGKGAAIGAAAGGGGGAAVQALTKGQQVKIPSETKLDFTTQDSFNVTYFPSKRTPRTEIAPPPAPDANEAPASNPNSDAPPASNSDKPPATNQL
jgi:hypothetical protein